VSLLDERGNHGTDLRKRSTGCAVWCVLYNVYGLYTIGKGDDDDTEWCGVLMVYDGCCNALKKVASTLL
jgi:hypothetical protein